MRKASKRIRALLRMVRPVIGDRVFKAENAALRDMPPDCVSGVRDGAVLVDAVGRMRGRYGHLLAPGVFGDLEDRLRRRHQRMLGRVLDDDDVLEHVVGEACIGPDRVMRLGPSTWRIPACRLVAVAAGSRSRTASRSIGPGIAATYREGQRANEIGDSQRRARALP